jgi:hypothetical protein
MELPEIVGHMMLWLPIKTMLTIRSVSNVYKKASMYYSTNTSIRVKKSLRWFKVTFPYLDHIVIKGRLDINDHDLQELSHVKHLDMSYCLQNSITNQCFQSMPNLRSLDLRGCCQSYLKGHHFTNAIFQHLTGLTSFYIDQNEVITNSGIQQLTNLTTLYVSNCNITNAGLSTLTKLVHLEMYNLKVTDDALDSLPNLEDLKLTFIPISTTGLLKLKKLKCLNAVNCDRINHCRGLETLPLSSLSLAYSTIKNEDFKYLCHLKSLTLYRSSITGTHVDQLHNLERLYMYYAPLQLQHLTSLTSLKKLMIVGFYDCPLSQETKQELYRLLGNKFDTN